MTSWVKEVPVEELVEGTSYFLGKKWTPGNDSSPSYMFYSQGLNGKQQWSGKPGIAIRTDDIEQLKRIIKAHTGNGTLVAITIPADADKRWKARQRRFH